MKVLFVNHTGKMSGAERSLLTLLAGLPTDIWAAVACPDGPLAEAVWSLGVPALRIPETKGSLKLHPWHTTRALADIARAGWALGRLTRDWEIDLVHANSIRAGMMATLAARLGGPPTLVHVRDSLPAGVVSLLALRFVGSHAAAVMPVSRYIEASIARGRPAHVHVIHNAVDLERFDPRAFDHEGARLRVGIGGSTAILAVVAQITPWKAQGDAIRVLARLKQDGYDVRLLLVGSAKFVSGATRHDNLAYLRRLEQLSMSLGVRDDVSFLGEREDVPEILRAVDVMLVPSWEEPFGRSVLEAMAMEVPVVATTVGGVSEIVRNADEGILLPPREPDLWAAVVANLLEHPDVRRRMGTLGRKRVAEDFTVPDHVEKVLATYAEVLAPERSPTRVRLSPRQTK